MVLRQRPRRASLVASLAFAVRGVVVLSELDVVRGVVGTGARSSRRPAHRCK